MNSTNGISKERCYRETARKGPSLIQDGKIILQTHHIGWIVAGGFAIIATIVSFWLVSKHLQWYTNKREQRYIVRLLFMVPIYALISLASYLFWNHSTPLLLIRDGYESTVLTAFFYLLLTYLSPYPEEQKLVYMKVGLSRHLDNEARKKGEVPKKWIFPLGFIKSKPQDGLYFLQMMKWGVLQYCVIRPTTTLAAVILDYTGLYCEESWGLGWGHIYITIIVSISVTVAMYCLIQLYVPVAKRLQPYKPLLKLFAIKAVVFLTFWQATFLSVLSMFGVVKDTDYMTAADINIGIGALLETFEMMLFAFLHIRAFTYRPYQPDPSSMSGDYLAARTPRLRSLGHAMDFRETFREIWIGCVYIFDKLLGKEPTPDLGARRVAHYEGAFGRSRPTQPYSRSRLETELSLRGEKTQPALPAVRIEVKEQVDIDIGGERQWLGMGDDYGYGLGYMARERSDGLEVQIERELERRGYLTRQDYAMPPLPDAQGVPSHGKKRSWWRSIYHRVSRSSQDDRSPRPSTRKLSRAQPLETNRGLLSVQIDEDDYTDPPPQSAIRAYRSQHHEKQGYSRKRGAQKAGGHDTLSHLSSFRESYHHQNAPGSASNDSGLHHLRVADIPAPLARHIDLPRSESPSGRVLPTSIDDILTSRDNHHDRPVPLTFPLPEATSITSDEGTSRDRDTSGVPISSPLSYPRDISLTNQRHYHNRESAFYDPFLLSLSPRLENASPAPFLLIDTRNHSYEPGVSQPLPTYNGASHPH